MFASPYRFYATENVGSGNLYRQERQCHKRDRSENLVGYPNSYPGAVLKDLVVPYLQKDGDHRVKVVKTNPCCRQTYCMGGCCIRIVNDLERITNILQYQATFFIDEVLIFEVKYLKFNFTTYFLTVQCKNTVH